MAKVIHFQERSEAARESLIKDRHARKRQTTAWAATIAIISGVVGYWLGRQKTKL